MKKYATFKVTRKGGSTMRQLFCITIGLFLFASTIYADNGLISLKSSHNVKTTADRLWLFVRS